MGVIYYFSKKLCTGCEVWAGALSRWSCQSPVAQSCGLLHHLNSLCGAMSKLNAKFDADSLLCLLSHFECHGYTVHMLTQQHLPVSRASTVKLSSFTRAHSSPLALTARLHQCQANCSCSINNGWTFPGQTSYTVWLLQSEKKASCKTHLNYF